MQLERAQNAPEPCALSTLDCLRLVEPLLPDAEVHEYSRLVQQTVLSYYRSHHDAVTKLVLADIVSAVLWRLAGPRQDYASLDVRRVVATVRALLNGLDDIPDAEQTISAVAANHIDWRLSHPEKAEEQLDTLITLGLLSSRL